MVSGTLVEENVFVQACGTFWTPVCDTEPPCEPGLAPVYHVQLEGKAVCFPQFFPPSEDAARNPPSTPTATPGADGAAGDDGFVGGDGGDGGDGAGGDFTPDEFFSSDFNGNAAFGTATGGATTTTTGSRSSPSPPTTPPPPPPPPVFDTDESEPLLVEQKEDESGDDDDEFGDDDSGPEAVPAVPQSSGGRARECTPIPGYYCSESNRLRRIKDRSREPRRARKE